MFWASGHVCSSVASCVGLVSVPPFLSHALQASGGRLVVSNWVRGKS